MSFSLPEHFQLMARYNSGANQRLYAVCAELSDRERRCIRPAFFHSIHGTLNHILLGDRIWMARFEGGQSPSTGLGAELYAEFEALCDARVAEDRRIDKFAAGLDDSFLSGEIAYRNNEGRDLTDPVALLVAHFFNHQTHHRGQVHDMLSQTGIETPVLDMHRVINP